MGEWHKNKELYALAMFDGQRQTLFQSDLEVLTIARYSRWRITVWLPLSSVTGYRR